MAEGVNVMQVVQCVAAAQLPVGGALRAAIQAVERSGQQQLSLVGEGLHSRQTALEQVLTELGAVQAAHMPSMAGCFNAQLVRL